MAPPSLSISAQVTSLPLALRFRSGFSGSRFHGFGCGPGSRPAPFFPRLQGHRRCGSRGPRVLAWLDRSTVAPGSRPALHGSSQAVPRHVRCARGARRGPGGRRPPSFPHRSRRAAARPRPPAARAPSFVLPRASLSHVPRADGRLLPAPPTHDDASPSVSSTFIFRGLRHALVAASCANQRRTRARGEAKDGSNAKRTRKEGRKEGRRSSTDRP
mmetsp:Transcript_853/g.5326  ORF Transcript_853/g.5326 Transcript_853/m.5326 type:complete len:215 (-) Transcript_853:3841-4485(-)